MRGIRDSGVDLKNFASQLLNFITENVGAKPYLSQLLVPLTRAEKSNFIEMELLSIFIRPDFVPQITPVKQQILSSPKPVQAQKTTAQPKVKNETFENPPSKKKKHEDFSKEKEIETSKAKTPTPQKEVETTEILLENEDLGEAREFKWGDFCNAVNEEDKGIQTILKQSGYAFENGKIKIYTGFPFKKKQLEKAKAQASIGKALKKINAGGWAIEVFETAKPANDPEIASVQDLMGGGEMVKIDE